MVPRADIKAVADDIDLDGLIQMVREFGHSRLPIYREILDDIVGIVHVKDVLTFFAGAGEVPAEEDPARAAVRRALDARCWTCCCRCAIGRAHMALVVDEYRRHRRPRHHRGSGRGDHRRDRGRA